MLRVLVLAVVEAAGGTLEALGGGLERIRRELSRQVRTVEKAKRFSGSVRQTIAKL